MQRLEIMALEIRLVSSALMKSLIFPAPIFITEQIRTVVVIKKKY